MPIITKISEAKYVHIIEQIYQKTEINKMTIMYVSNIWNVLHLYSCIHGMCIFHK